jgi:HSP20 family protein
MTDMLLRFDPFRDLDRFANDLLGTGHPTLAASMPRPMPMDCYRHGDAFYLHFDLPGIDVETLDVTQENNTLTVHALRKFVAPTDATYLVNERPMSSYSRQLIVGDGLSLDAIVAEYRDGVLTLTIPVAETATARRIPVDVGAVGGTGLPADLTPSSGLTEGQSLAGAGV